MVKKKRASKRLTLHKKYKIARKVREHKRKERKTERLNVHKKKKDPGIPNSWPFKEELLQQVEAQRLAEIEAQKLAQQKRKEEKKNRKRLEREAQNGVSNIPKLTPLSVEMQAKKDLKDAMLNADMIFMVLDARDPQGCRSLSLEDGIIGQAGKKLVLIVNKIDLISPDTAAKWVTYLRRFHPTIPVRSLNNNVKEVKKKSRQAKGQQAIYDREQELIELRDNGHVKCLHHFLDSLANHFKQEKPLNIAVMGYPNVGKSTLINSLKKKQIASVSAVPKTTKRSLEVAYNDKITLIDCPPLDPEYSDISSIVMRHGLADIYLDDPIPSLKDLLERCEVVNLMTTLQLPMYKDNEDFLKKFAIKRNLYRKGGDPDILLAARTFIRNLGNGIYGTSCLPPHKSKSRFELPEWFSKVLAWDKFQEEEKLLYTSNRRDQTRVILLNSTALNHRVGDTTEYDLVLGQLPECDGLTSSEDEVEGYEDDETMQEN